MHVLAQLSNHAHTSGTTAGTHRETRDEGGLADPDHRRPGKLLAGQPTCHPRVGGSHWQVEVPTGGPGVRACLPRRVACAACCMPYSIGGWQSGVLASGRRCGNRPPEPKHTPCRPPFPSTAARVALAPRGVSASYEHSNSRRRHRTGTKREWEGRMWAGGRQHGARQRTDVMLLLPQVSSNRAAAAEHNAAATLKALPAPRRAPLALWLGAAHAPAGRRQAAHQGVCLLLRPRQPAQPTCPQHTHGHHHPAAIVRGGCTARDMQLRRLGYVCTLAAGGQAAGAEAGEGTGLSAALPFEYLEVPTD